MDGVISQFQCHLSNMIATVILLLRASSSNSDFVAVLRNDVYAYLS